MATFPLPLADMLGHWGSYGIYALVGIAFGMTLESAGFGNRLSKLPQIETLQNFEKGHSK